MTSTTGAKPDDAPKAQDHVPVVVRSGPADELSPLPSAHAPIGA